MIKAIIFDADGVVINTSPIYSKADQIFLTSHGISANQKEIDLLLTGLSLENGVKVLQNKFGLKGSHADLLKQRMNIIKNLYVKIDFIPGFLNFFDRLKLLGLKTAIATSSHVDFFAIAEQQLSLDKLFEGHIYFLKDVNHVSKPLPDIFLYAAKMLITLPEHCLVIEDAVNGIKAAKSAGMKCAALTTTHGKEMLTEADQIVDSFEEIKLEQF
ncbi:MAG: HAD family phosphatase [Candidatus Doudnabacteria bacterium]|nr:HAD family phosphatase [Candidatus Doudnabacteria bacterium]